MSLQEVVRTVHMKLDLARLRHRVVDVLITDLAKFFDVIPQDVHPIVGARVGLGEADHLATHTEGFSYTLPLGPWQSSTLAQLFGTPRALSRGSMRAQRRLSRSYASWTSRTGPLRYNRFASQGSCGWTTRSSYWNGATPYTGGLAGSTDILPGYPAGGCPGPQNPARVDIRPPTPTLAHSGSRSLTRWPRVDNG